MKTLLKITLFLGVASVLYGHHGLGGNYDSQQRVTLKGVVKECMFANPHVVVKIEVDGKLWEVTIAAPGPLRAAGLAEEVLKPGAEATFWGSVHKTKPNDMYASGITVGTATFGNR